MYPFFDAPAAGRPMKYVGWEWDPKAGEWVESRVREIEIEVPVTRYPKPKKPPQPWQPLDVPGWKWNGREGIWEERPMPYEIVWVTPPRPPKPKEWPSRTQPAEVPGWRYSYMYEVWEKIPMEQVQEKVQMERTPMPKYPPGSEQLSVVEGWSWSEARREWVATIVVAEKVGFRPPRSLPPGVTQDAWMELYSFEQLFIEEVTYFVNQGYTLEAARRITRDNFDNLIRMMYAQERAGAIRSWTGLVSAVSGMPEIEVQELTVYALVALVAAAVGYLIGTILRGLLLHDEESLVMGAKPNTYLLGPGNWAYSRNIGTSLGGIPYYSDCGGIGAGYSRHKRAEWGGRTDIIDFPGGFVEEGYVFPYFVKYTWSYWKVRYVGMLSSVGSNIYALKKGDSDAGAPVPLGQLIPFGEWCEGFDWYL